MSSAVHSARRRQAVLVEPRHLELRHLVPPRPGPGELLLDVKCALSCGTDLKFYRRGHPMFRFPSPLGHEFSGIVAESGPGVDNFRPGDALMAAPTAPCGSCFFCSRGQENLCSQAIEIMVMGAYADFLLLPAPVVARNAFQKPADLSFEEAALLEPLACVVHAHCLAHPEPGETALVIGAGAFGLLHALMLKAEGIDQIAVAGRGKPRLGWASELGAAQVIDVAAEDAEQRTKELNHGYGADLVIEATGQVAGWEAALRAVRRGGRVIFFGGCPAETQVALDTRRMHYDNLTLLAPFHYRPQDVGRAYELLAAHKLRAGRIINGRRPLAELVEVFEGLERGEFLKCAIIP